jgi:hypothetical protein
MHARKHRSQRSPESVAFLLFVFRGVCVSIVAEKKKAVRHYKNMSVAPTVRRSQNTVGDRSASKTCFCSGGPFKRRILTARRGRGEQTPRMWPHIPRNSRRPMGGLYGSTAVCTLTVGDGWPNRSTLGHACVVPHWFTDLSVDLLYFFSQIWMIQSATFR